jgi:preprotein translocase subunit SecG
MILMQRGAGAQAGSGFGAGASATVFGARGASNFLSKSTKWLAIVFFAISLFMAWHITRSEGAKPVAQDLGLMGSVPAAPAQAPAQQVPAAPAGTNATPTQDAPAQSAPVPAAPAQQGAAPAETPKSPAPAQGG